MKFVGSSGSMACMFRSTVFVIVYYVKNFN